MGTQDIDVAYVLVCYEAAVVVAIKKLMFAFLFSFIYTPHSHNTYRNSLFSL